MNVLKKIMFRFSFHDRSCLFNSSPVFYHMSCLSLLSLHKAEAQIEEGWDAFAQWIQARGQTHRGEKAQTLQGFHHQVGIVLFAVRDLQPKSTKHLFKPSSDLSFFFHKRFLTTTCCWCSSLSSLCITNISDFFSGAVTSQAKSLSMSFGKTLHRAAWRMTLRCDSSESLPGPIFFTVCSGSWKTCQTVQTCQPGQLSTAIVAFFHPNKGYG